MPIVRPMKDRAPSVIIHLLTPVANLSGVEASKVLETLLGDGWYVFPQRVSQKLRPGDRICFYEKKVGIVAAAKVASAPEANTLGYSFIDAKKFCWAFRVND